MNNNLKDHEGMNCQSAHLSMQLAAVTCGAVSTAEDPLHYKQGSKLGLTFLLGRA